MAGCSSLPLFWLNEDTDHSLQNIINLGKIKQVHLDYVNQILPGLTQDLALLPSVQPGGKIMLAQNMEEGTTRGPASTQWKGPLQVMLATPTMLKLQGIPSWGPLTRIKHVPPDLPQDSSESHEYTCEPIENLKFLFKRLDL